MTPTRKLLFLITAGGRDRLVLRDERAGRFETVWRSPEGGGQMARAERLEEVVRQAHGHIAQSHLEGLVVVAPAGELEDLTAELESAVVIVGGVPGDHYGSADDDLAEFLDKALHAPLPER